MTEQEAIKVIEGYKRLDTYMNNTDRLPACDMAIAALKKQIPEKASKTPDITPELAHSAIRVIIDYCRNQDTCNSCKICGDCMVCFHGAPKYWEVSDGNK